VTTVPLAGFITRAIALAIDGAVLVAITTIAGLAVALAGRVVGIDFHSGDPALAALTGFWWFAIVSVYLATFWRLTGQTPGMRVMGVRVIDRAGGRVGHRQALTRLVGMALAAIPLGAGFLWILVDDRRQGWHDHLASTLVISVPARAPASRAAPATAEEREGIDLVHGDRGASLGGHAQGVGHLGPEALGE
jgi:uncharacterized RDD family membrane protein YckC